MYVTFDALMLGWDWRIFPSPTMAVGRVLYREMYFFTGRSEICWLRDYRAPALPVLWDALEYL